MPLAEGDHRIMLAEHTKTKRQAHGDPDIGLRDGNIINIVVDSAVRPAIDLRPLGSRIPIRRASSVSITPHDAIDLVSPISRAAEKILADRSEGRLS